MNLINTGSKIVVLLIILVVLGLMAYAIFGDRASAPTSPLIGKQAPEFQIALFDGNEVTLKDLEGKTVLLNFWASWCFPCRQEAPALERSWLRYINKDVVFLGVNVWDQRPEAMAYLKQFGGGYGHGTDRGESIQIDYGVGGVPETYFISPSGVVTGKFEGALSEKDINEHIEQALNYRN